MTQNTHFGTQRGHFPTLFPYRWHTSYIILWGMFQMLNQQKSLHETNTRPSTSDRMPSGSGTSESRAPPKSTSWRHKTRHGKEGSSFQFFLFANATVSYASCIFRRGGGTPWKRLGLVPYSFSNQTISKLKKGNLASVEEYQDWSHTEEIFWVFEFVRIFHERLLGQATVRLLQRGQASAMVVLRSTWDFPHSATSHTAPGGQRMCLEPARASSKSEATANEGLYARRPQLCWMVMMLSYLKLWSSYVVNLSLGHFHQNVVRLTTSRSPQQTGRHAQVNRPSIRK